jgi:uncharacterized protein YutE (UPF0331/DUF86 family)
MRHEIYQTETAHIAREQGAVLDAARAILAEGRTLNALERNGVLHALQVLVENAIGKAKRILKAANEPVPESAHDAFAALARVEHIAPGELPSWNAVIGLLNRIVRDYMNIDMNIVLGLVGQHRETPVVEFLLAPMPRSTT